MIDHKLVESTMAMTDAELYALLSLADSPGVGAGTASPEDHGRGVFERLIRPMRATICGMSIVVEARRHPGPDAAALSLAIASLFEQTHGPAVAITIAVLCARVGLDAICSPLDPPAV
jgi:hypothetical protein